MTAQSRERLLYKGEEVGMTAEPLNQYLKNGNDIGFVFTNTACWRGYRGKWEIMEGKLYLIEITGSTHYAVVDLNYLFPGQEKVFASWFSGEISIPQGEMLKYVHMGYGSIYEKDLVLKFEEGVLLEEKVIDNREDFENQ